MVHRVDSGLDDEAGTGDDTITTVAGTGTTGFAGDGGPATEATFREPRGLAATFGAILVADSVNKRVRRIDRATGVIDTVAGTGIQTNRRLGPGDLGLSRHPARCGGGPERRLPDRRQRYQPRAPGPARRRDRHDRGRRELRRLGGRRPGHTGTALGALGVNLASNGDLYISGAGLATTPSANQRVRVVSDALADPRAAARAGRPRAHSARHRAAHRAAGRCRSAGRPGGPGRAARRTARPVPALAPLRLTLTARTAARGRAPRVVALRIAASRALAGRRVVVQLGTRVRVGRRTVLRYRNVTAVVVRARAAGVRLTLARPGSYRARLSCDAGRARTTAPITLVARARTR